MSPLGIKEGGRYGNRSMPNYYRHVEIIVESPSRPGGAVVAWSTDMEPEKPADKLNRTLVFADLFVTFRDCASHPDVVFRLSIAMKFLLGVIEAEGEEEQKLLGEIQDAIARARADKAEMDALLTEDARKSFWRVLFPLMVVFLLVSLASFVFLNPLSGFLTLLVAVAIPVIAYTRNRR